MAIGFGKKSRSNVNISSNSGVISVDSMIDFVDYQSQAKRSSSNPSESNGVLSVDSMFSFVGDSGSTVRRHKGRRHNRVRKVAVLLLVMVVTSGGMSAYTINKVDANIKQAKSEASARATKFTEAGEPAFNVTTETMKDSTSNLMSTVTETAGEQSDLIEHEKRVANFLGCMDDLADRIIANNFWYSNSNNSPTYSGALKKKKVTNCARYISWAMQDAGLIPSGATFWLNTKINGNASAITSSPYLEVSYPKAKASSLDLQPGDIVGWGSSGGQHTAVYAGKDSSGNNLWYSAGGDGTHRSGGKKYFDSSMKARTRSGYDSHRIDVLIRIK